MHQAATAAKETRHSPIRYERTLTLIGALIVFVTFVGKDAIRERYKEQADSILSAVNRFSIIGEVERHGAGQQTIAVWLMYELSSGLAKKEIIGTQLSILFEREINSVAELSALGEILKRAPEENLKKRLDDTVQRLGALSQDRIGVIGMLAPPDRSTANLDEQVESLSAAYDKIEDEVLNLSADVRTFAEKRLESAERHYQWWTWVSYCLYALGWGLALFARLRGFVAWGEADA